MIDKRNRMIEALERDKVKLVRENSALSKKVKRLESFRNESASASGAAEGGPDRRGTSMPSRLAVTSQRPDVRSADNANRFEEELADLSRKLVQREGEARVLQLENAQIRRKLALLEEEGAIPEIEDSTQEWMRKADMEARQRLETANDNMLLAFDLEQAKAQLEEARQQRDVDGKDRPQSKAGDRAPTNVQYMKLKKERDKYKKMIEAAAKGEHDKRRATAKSEAGEVAKLRSDLKRCKADLDKEKQALRGVQQQLQRVEEERRALQAVPKTTTAETANRYRQQVTEQLLTIKQLETDKQRLQSQLQNQLDRTKQVESALDEARAENADLHSELASFDPQFFDEIEELKFQHGAVAEANALLKNELRRIGKEHGIHSMLLQDGGGLVPPR
mmetsp:Transcript_7533/g.22206  ORF Transcript_7533/g.22206 Transcript_7533/m.22206 type:complete len:391 (-) Transcript_7533:72-1244(-)